MTDVHLATLETWVYQLLGANADQRLPVPKESGSLVHLASNQVLHILLLQGLQGSGSHVSPSLRHARSPL